VDPRKPDLPLLHEWHFRSGLDRYIWIIGMIYAYFHPMVSLQTEQEETGKSRTKEEAAAVLVRTQQDEALFSSGSLLPPCSCPCSSPCVQTERALERLEDMHVLTRNVIRAVIVAISLVVRRRCP